MHGSKRKPLTRDVWEGRTVARVAKETGVATQMGNFGRSSEGHRQTAEWIWDGAIGPIRDNRLKTGYWRELTAPEVEKLRKAAQGADMGRPERRT